MRTPTPSLTRPARHRGACAAALAVGLLCLTVPVGATLAAPAQAATPTPLRISPGGAGLRNGSDWANAGDLKDLPRFITSRPSGGEVWVRGDAGPYQPTASVGVKTGGAAGAPVVVRGVDVNGSPAARPVVVGTRTSPYSSTGNPGGEVFKLYSGAKHLVFDNLSFRNEGTVFAAGGNTSDVTITNVTATNVRRFYNNSLATGETTANVSDLTLSHITVAGFSKSVLSLQYDSHGVLVEDVSGDSQQQDGDDFALGVHLDATVHDVVLRRVSMRNSTDTLHDYWNGDGFATERGVYGVRFEDTVASGNTDAGYDLKSRSTSLLRTVASDNKRNYRFWGPDTTVAGCTLTDPRKRGGVASQTQVWLAGSANVTMQGCSVTDTSTATHVFELEANSHLLVQDSTVSRAAAATLAQVEGGATLQYQNTTLATMP